MNDKWTLKLRAGITGSRYKTRARGDLKTILKNLDAELKNSIGVTGIKIEKEAKHD